MSFYNSNKDWVRVALARSRLMYSCDLLVNIFIQELEVAFKHHNIKSNSSAIRNTLNSRLGSSFPLTGSSSRF